ncbi:MAG TPA: MarR family transcriptional regulator [Steroidobacteraceae bacterium]|nr:MarR family transcriptional regulator [Steroidobacteraceae bacterium]
MIRQVATKLTNVKKAVPGADLAFAIGPLIGRVRTLMLSSLDSELQPFGMTGMQFAILKNLADGSATTSADLCRLLHYDAGSMTRLVDRLEAKGLLRRERSEDDRRVVSLRVTSSGKAVLPRLRDSAGRVVQRMLVGFSAPEVNHLRSLLDRMIENGLTGTGK